MTTAQNDEFPAWLDKLNSIMAVFQKPGFFIKTTHTSKFDGLKPRGYDELRHEIHDGDLLFCSGTHPISKIIRYFSGRSRVSHVGILYWWHRRLMLLESVEDKGVRIVPLRHYLVNYENSEIPYPGRLFLARDQRIAKTQETYGNSLVESLLHEAACKLNKRFSIGEMLRFFWRGTTGWGKNWENDCFLCSEFVAMCFKTIKLDYPDSGSGFVTPEDIASSPHVVALNEIKEGVTLRLECS